MLNKVFIKKKSLFKKFSFSVKYLEAIDGERMKAGDCVNSGVPCSPQIPRAMEKLRGGD